MNTCGGIGDDVHCALEFMDHNHPRRQLTKNPRTEPGQKNIIRRFSFFFEIELTAKDIEDKSLFIPRTQVPELFPRPQANREELIAIYDAYGNVWDMVIVEKVDGFLIAQGLKEFVDNHRLKPRDKIRFCIPSQREFAWEYYIFCVEMDEWNSQSVVQLQLQPTDVKEDRLVIPLVPKQDYFFTPLLNPGGTSEKMQLRDTGKIDWDMTFVHDPDRNACLITDGWQRFVDAHNLEANDEILIYGPFYSSGKVQFLVGYEKQSHQQIGKLDEELLGKERAHQVGKTAMKITLFDLVLTSDAITQGRLYIPVSAIDYLPPISVITGTSEQIIHIWDRGNRCWRMLLVYDRDECSFKITSGWQEFVDWNNLKVGSTIRFILPALGISQFNHYLVEITTEKGLDVVDSADVDILKFFSSRKVDGLMSPQEVIFKVWWRYSDVKLGRLVIPIKDVVRVVDCLPPIMEEAWIEVTDTERTNWQMKLTCNRSEKCLEITKGWEEFAIHHKLEARDEITFSRPNRRLHDSHYIIHHEKHKKLVFVPENFLFEIELTFYDAVCNYIKLHRRETAGYFPQVYSYTQNFLTFTDVRGKEWSMRYDIEDENHSFMIVNGWDEYVKEYALRETDLVKFYKPDKPSHPLHFLICHDTGKRNDTDLRRPSEHEAKPGSSWWPLKTRKVADPRKAGSLTDHRGRSNQGKCWSWRRIIKAFVGASRVATWTG